MSELSEVLQTAIDAAHTGGEILKGYFVDGVAIRNKSATGGKSYDLVSDADVSSERAIADLLRQRYPAHEVLGEEDLQSADMDAEHLWIVDPLDGTNNFAHRIPHFAVSVAYYERGVATAGAVWNPIRDDLYTAVRGQGAFHNGSPIGCSDASSLDQAMIGCGFYYDRGEMMRRTLAAIEDCFVHSIHGIRRFGTASLDLCQVASGCFEAFFEYNLSVWDFAAGALIIQEAGGTITTARGEPLPIANTSLLASNGLLHQSMLEITRRHHP